jgi:hypothetical protein
MELETKQSLDLFEVAGIVSMLSSVSMIAYVVFFHW